MQRIFVPAYFLTATLLNVSVIAAPTTSTKPAKPTSVKPTSGKPAPLKLPVNQTVGDATIQIKEIGWRALSNFDHNNEYRKLPSPPYVFVVSFEVIPTGVLPRGQSAMTLTSMVKVTIVSPDGKRLEGRRVSQSSLPSIAAVAPENLPPEQQKSFSEYSATIGATAGIRIWDDTLGVDPAWENFTLVLEYETPTARRVDRTRRMFGERADFVDIPLPTTVDQPLSLNAKHVTAGGVTVMLESAIIKPRRDNPDDNTLYVVGRWLPPASDPGFRADIGLSYLARREGLSQFEYNTGEPFTDRTHHTGISDGKEPGKNDETPGYFKISASAPPAEAKSMSMRLQVLDKRTQKPDADLARRIEVPLRRTDFAVPSPLSPATNPLATVALGNDKLSLLSLKAIKPHFHGEVARWQGELLLQSSKPLGFEHDWQSFGVSYPNFYTRWKSNGTQLGANEKIMIHELSWMPQKESEAIPEKMNFSMDWREVNRTSFPLEWKDLPIPASGAITNVDKALPVGTHGQFVLRKIGAFSAEQTLSKDVETRLKNMQPPSGLAVVLEYLPANSATPVIWNDFPRNSTWDILVPAVTDDSGLNLSRRGDKVVHSPKVLLKDDLISTANRTGTYFTTLYFLPPTPNSKTFSLNLNAVHQQFGEKIKTSFTDVQLPPPLPVAPKP